MIISNMNNQEVRKEALNDYESIIAWFLRNKNGFRRQIIKTSKFPTYSKLEYQSRNKNDYGIVLEAKSKKDADNYLYAIYGTFNQGGLSAFLFTGIKPDLDIVILSPHLFSRYRERFLHNNEISNLDLIKYFFQFNSTFAPSPSNTENEYYAACTHGFLLGKMDNGVVVFKTYISFDMLTQDQEEGNRIDEVLKFREEI